MSEKPICKIEGCTDEVGGRGMCDIHYHRWHRTGVAERGPCKVDGCDKQGWGRHNLCRTHSYRLRVYGDPLAEPGPPAECKIDGCDSPVGALGMCYAHYSRKRRYGDPLAEGNAPMEDYLPDGPLRDYIDARGLLRDVMWGRTDGEVEAARQALVRSRDRGGWMSVSAADQFCIRWLGVHPYMVWGDDWWVDDEDGQQVA